MFILFLCFTQKQTRMARIDRIVILTPWPHNVFEEIFKKSSYFPTVRAPIESNYIRLRKQGNFFEWTDWCKMNIINTNTNGDSDGSWLFSGSIRLA